MLLFHVHHNAPSQTWIAKPEGDLEEEISPYYVHDHYEENFYFVIGSVDEETAIMQAQKLLVDNRPTK